MLLWTITFLPSHKSYCATRQLLIWINIVRQVATSRYFALHLVTKFHATGNMTRQFGLTLTTVDQQKFDNLTPHIATFTL